VAQLEGGMDFLQEYVINVKPKCFVHTKCSPIWHGCLVTWSVGACSRTVTISVAKAPFVSASAFASEMCASSTMQVTSSFGGSATGVFWSGFIPGSLAPSFPFTVFTPHTSQAGTQVVLVWTSVNPPACPPAMANVTVTVFASPIVTARPPINVYSSGPTPVQLQGTLSGTANCGRLARVRTWDNI
jgi:hypothetical protein